MTLHQISLRPKTPQLGHSTILLETKSGTPWGHRTTSDHHLQEYDPETHRVKVTHARSHFSGDWISVPEFRGQIRPDPDPDRHDVQNPDHDFRASDEMMRQLRDFIVQEYNITGVRPTARVIIDQVSISPSDPNEYFQCRDCDDSELEVHQLYVDQGTPTREIVCKTCGTFTEKEDGQWATKIRIEVGDA